MTTPNIRELCANLGADVYYLLACIRDGSSDLDTLQEIADRADAARDSLRIEPVGDDGDVAIDRWIESRPDWPNSWPAVTQSQLTALIGEALEHWGRPAALAAEPEAPAEALAARPLLEQVARLDDCIGANTVGGIMAISSRARAWLEANPQGQPVAIEPRGCPTPGACSCVEPVPPVPPAPLQGEVGDSVKWLLHHADDRGEQPDGPCTRIATLLKQLSAAAPAVVPEGEPSDEDFFRVAEQAAHIDQDGIVDALNEGYSLELTARDILEICRAVYRLDNHLPEWV